MNNVRRVRTAIFLLLAATFPAVAEEAAPTPAPAPAPTTEPAATPVAAPPAPEAPPAPGPSAQPAVPAPADANVTPTATLSTAAVPAKKEEAKKPWRGSSISYSYNTTASTLNPGIANNSDGLVPQGEEQRHPSLVHRIDLRPEWHFGDQLYIRGLFRFSQEFFVGNSGSYGHQVVWLDPMIDVGVAGYEIPVAKIKVGGSVRAIGGLSKASASDTMIVGVGPGVSISRSFDIRSGLQIAYSGRLTEYAHRFQTKQNAGAAVPEMCSPADLTCYARQEGTYNTHTDLLHGPSVSFSPIEKLSISGTFLMYRGWEYGATAEQDAQVGVSVTPINPVTTHDLYGGSLDVSYQVLPELSLSVGTFTLGEQRKQNSHDLENAVWNQSSSLYLNLGLDVEALLKRI